MAPDGPDSGNEFIDAVWAMGDASREEPAGETATKRRGTYYTEADRRAARRNVGRYDWATARRDAAVSAADRTLEGGLDAVWELVTAQSLPRSLKVHNEATAGSPVSGADIYEVDTNYPWRVDPVEEPWKVVDPVSGYRFPTNDFRAYYESGLDSHHEFDRERADDDLLVNELYPEHGEQWGVDDGSGWVDDQGRRRTFVAYYNSWAIWRSAESVGAQHPHAIEEVLAVLREAYLLSGDRRYARAGTVLLDRVADVYPAMDVSAYPEAEGFTHSDGSTELGKVFGSIGEQRLVDELLRSYDAFFPAQPGDDTLVEFLSEKARRYDLGEKSSVERIRENIEANVVREVLPAVENAQIRGNFGLHQSSLALSAVVQDDPDGYTAEALEFMFRAGGTVGRGDDSRETRLTGGNVLAELVDVFDRDGHAEESPGYNLGAHFEGVRAIAEILDGYDAYEGPSLFENVKGREMHAAPVRMVMLNRYYPHIGDSSKPGTPGFEFDREAALDAYKRYGEKRYAQTVGVLTDGSTERLRGSVFDPDPEAVVSDIEAVLGTEGPLDLPSISEAGFGLITLRDGHPPGRGSGESRDVDTQRAMWLYHGKGRSYSGHNHSDALNLGVFAHALNLAPDIGYPEQPGTWPKGINWTKNTVSHNTVVVDRTQQLSRWHEPSDRGGVGEPRGFDATDRVKLLDVEAPGVYPQTELYRRTTAMIAVDARRSYGVDFFRVRGGDEHHFSFHGGEGSVAAGDLELAEQETGTYAGPEVPLPEYGEDTDYNADVGDGFNYLHTVRRDDDPPATFSVEWDIEDTYGVRAAAGLSPEAVSLRLTMLGDVDDVALADADLQRDATPDTFTYMLAHSAGEDLTSTFTSVIEPYACSRFVESIRRAPVTVEGGGDVRAVEIELRDGRTDYVVSAPDPTATYTVEGAFRATGAFAVYSERDGAPEHAYLHGGRLLAPLAREDPLLALSRGRYEGAVTSFTRELGRDNELGVRITAGPREACPLADLEGEWVYVDTDGPRNGAYEIRSVTVEDETHATLSVGQKTTVQEFADPETPEAGFVYTVSEGDRFEIPVGVTWTADSEGDRPG